MTPEQIAKILALIQKLPPTLITVAPSLVALAIKVANEYQALNSDKRVQIVAGWVEDVLAILNKLEPAARAQLVAIVLDYFPGPAPGLGLTAQIGSNQAVPGYGASYRG